VNSTAVRVLKNLQELKTVREKSSCENVNSTAVRVLKNLQEDGNGGSEDIAKKLKNL